MGHGPGLLVLHAWWGLNETMMDFCGRLAAEGDPYEPASSVRGLEDSLRAAGRPVTIHSYAGTGHWFFEADRPDAYDAAAAELAWGRTVAFLREELRATA